MRISIHRLTHVLRLLVLLAFYVAIAMTTFAQSPITVHHWVRGSDANFRFIQEQIPAFERDNPGIKIELVYVSPALAHERYLIAFATNLELDVLWTNPNVNLQHYMTRDWLLPLDELALAVDLDMDAFYPSVVDLARWQDDLYGIPYAALPAPALIYNADLFDQAGLTYPEPTWTYTEAFLSAARKITRDTSGDGIPDILGFSRPVYGDVLTILAAFGGGVLTDDGQEILVDRPATLEALSFLDSMVNEYQVMRPAIGTDVFRAGAQGMVFDAYWSLPAYVNHLPDSSWTVTMPPLGSAGRYTVFYNGYYSIARQSANPEAAMRWIKHLVSEEVGKAWIRANLNPTAHAAVNADPEFLAAPHHRAWIDLYNIPAIPYTMPSNFRSEQITQAFDRALTRILDRSQSIAQSVGQVKQEIQAIMSDVVQ